MKYTHSYIGSFSSEFFDYFSREKRIIFKSNEELGAIDKEKKEKEQSVGDKAVETHARAEKHKKQVEKSPLRKFIDKNPDSEVAAADEARNEGIADAVKGEDHQKVAGLILGNVPPEAGKEIVGSLMNDYS